MPVHGDEHCENTTEVCGHKGCPYNGAACPYCLCNHAGICSDCGCDVDQPDHGCDCGCHRAGMSDDQLRRAERRQMGIE